MGQVWLPAGDVLFCGPTWFCSGCGFEKLHAASEEVTYEPGQGQAPATAADLERRRRAAVGWTSEEIVGRPLTVIIPERFRELDQEGIARVRRTGVSKLAGQVVELAGLRRDGVEFPIELSIGSWNGPDGIAFSGVLRDITDRKRAEAALAGANRELERASAELETLVHSASHDLQSPITWTGWPTAPCTCSSSSTT
jgi:PAS domain S-box-containing protein